MTYVPTKEVKIKEKQDKILREQLQKEREQQLLEEIDKTEKERIRKKGKAISAVIVVGLKTLKNSGILDSYQNLLTSLCKYGLPTGDLYEFSALTILKYEKKLKLQKKKELEERLKQRGNSKNIQPRNLRENVDQLLQEEAVAIKKQRVSSVTPKPEKKPRAKNEEQSADDGLKEKPKQRKTKDD